MPFWPNTHILSSTSSPTALDWYGIAAMAPSSLFSSAPGASRSRSTSVAHPDGLRDVAPVSSRCPPWMQSPPMSLDIVARTVTSPLSTMTTPSPARTDDTRSASSWPATAPVTAPWSAALGSEPQAVDAEADEYLLSDEYDDSDDDLPSSLFGCPWSAQDDDDDADLEEGEIRHNQVADPVVISSSLSHPLRAVSTGPEPTTPHDDSNDADVEAQAAALWGRLADLFDLQQQQQQPMTALADDHGALADDALLDFLPASPTSPPLAPNGLVDPLSVDGPPVLDVNALYQYYLGPDLPAQLTVDQLYDWYVAPPESASTSTNHDDDDLLTSPTPCGPIHHAQDDDLSHLGSTASTSGSSASMTTTTAFAPAELDYDLDPDADPDALLPDRLNWNSTLLVDSPLPRRRPTVLRARAAPGPVKPRLVMLPDGWSFGSEPPTPSHDMAAQYGTTAGSVLRSPSPPGSVLRSRGPTGGARPRTHSLMSSSSLWPAEVASTLPSPDSGELHASGVASSLASPRAGMAPVQGWWSPPPPRAEAPARDRDRPFGPAAIQSHQSPRSPLAWEF
ncbi:hypothetical protein AMAG_03445 [Allomyces macrogynus ATCC 38327]|uniref:Uncharacterized protein n=1 Tax=Allomyces macrogynus (strain ATCC 38327) TaxID=578462 RepID=A0A0L0S9H2_ALLM3|nr:hypothetical protein AMAG_03445 [Allomyces macrogynus ATCC 38327]|eukprot:KNE59102.1 hypothetical protein AMAG_03445 [Allomyces macrogynus ATCC 38327]